MALRAPVRIWGLLLFEQVRLLALTATGLAVVIAFAAAVKPLADGQIEFGEALQLMGFALVPMLQFALPFAAGFAATMTYHRFAAEREATAAMAGGIGHRALLVPAAVLGLVLSVVLTLLTNQVIPGFLRNMELVVAENAARVISSAVERGESLRLDSWDVHAGGVAPLDADSAPGAFEALMLTDVFAVQMDDEGVVASVNAARAGIWMFAGDGEGDDSITVRLRFQDAQLAQRNARGRLEGGARSVDVVPPPMQVPGSFSEDPKFMTYGELVELRGEPERIKKVQTLRRAVAARIAEHQMVDSVDAQLRTMGTAELVHEETDARLTIVGSELVREDGVWRVRRGAGESVIRLVRTNAAGAETVHTARGVTIAVEAEDTGDFLFGGRMDPRLEVSAMNVSTVRAGGDEVDAERRELVFRGMRTETDYMTPLVDTPVRVLQRQSREIALQAGEDESGAIMRARNRMKERVEDLQREITSKQHERAAFSVTGLLMVMTGGVVGFKMRDSLALPVYMWSFFPALIAVITIGAGQGMAHKSGDSGLVLLWSGVVALGVFTLYEYGKLRKH